MWMTPDLGLLRDHTLTQRWLRLSKGHQDCATSMERWGRLPVVVACVGGGSNAMGIFYPFVQDTEVALVGVEAAGEEFTPPPAAQ